MTATTGFRLSPAGPGVTRITLPLPWALDHVHCYAVEAAGGWTVVDGGLGGPGADALWREVLAALGDPPVRRIVITHYHPDHVGGTAALQRASGAQEVVQGAHDRRLTELVWEGEPGAREFADYLAGHGMPVELAAASAAAELRLMVEPAVPTRTVTDGDVVEIGDSRHTVRLTPGHADGHIVLDAGRGRPLFGGDLLLGEITPNVGRWPDTRADPLGRYLHSLEVLASMAPSTVLPGHGRPVTDVAGRIAEIRAHHEQRLDAHVAALERGATTAYDVAQLVWAADGLGFHEQRFALVEAVSHLERLALLGRAERGGDGGWRPETV
ncbi:MAG TPA: MBL fold metallo-hydrolase [Gaiellales bacterium]|nr:MBL fold metallo-hydrolase [Gaiellales bacterium]